MPHLTETIELIVSELVTNAVRATTGPGGQPRYDRGEIGLPVVHVRLLSDGLRVAVEVWDRNPQAPVPKQADPDDESGRGLMLVEALCERWGWNVKPGWHGKVVWAELQVE
jgi:anti-sigma regulatory factor (Ser/Thr protein kinase)